MLRRIDVDITTSTNDLVRSYSSPGSPAMVTAQYQSQGRGRNGKAWEGEPESNLYTSIGIEHQTPPSTDHLYSYHAFGCLAAYRTLANLAPGHMFRIKYPNDVYGKIEDGTFRKISGVLTENDFNGSVCLRTIVGIGINVGQTVFPVQLRAKASSLALLTGKEFNARAVADVLQLSVEHLLHTSPHVLMDEWRRLLGIVGKEVTVIGTQDRWKASEILDDGRLCLHPYSDLPATGQAEELIVGDGDSILYDLD